MTLSAYQRYQYKPFVGSSHSWARTELLKIPQEASILDIGPGSGAVGKLLKETGFSKLYAVEIDHETRKYLNTTYVQVEESLDAYEGKQFDVILLLDILEHLTDPAEFFAKVLAMLNKGGYLLISLPNIAHWTIRLSLLFGFFEYTKRGLLDKTHYQFYTLRRFRKLLEQHAELSVESTSVSIPPLEFLLPELLWNNKLYRALSRVRLCAAQTFPTLFAYQLLALVKKN